MWIDYNQSGIFDASEYTYLGSGNGSTVSSSITIPGTAMAGTTKMRVRVRWSSSIANTDACTGFTYGEAEDYNVTLVCPSLSVSGDPANTAVCTGSNATFSASGGGIALTYQWQENTGSSWANVSNGGIYSGATTSTL